MTFYFLNNTLQEIENQGKMYHITQNSNFFNLSLNENYLSFCKETLLKLENLNRYPNIETYKQIQKQAQILYQTDHEILLTNGSDDGIFLIQQWFKQKWKKGNKPSEQPGASIIITNPTFSMYENYAKNLGINIIKINLDSNLLINLPTLISTIQQNPNCLVFIPNPNSPTGTMLSNNQITNLLNQNATIVIDEAYIEFSQIKSSTSLLNKHPNLIILRTLSKFYGLAGVRIGFAISNHSKEIQKFQAPFSVSSLNAEIALKTLKYINQNQNEVMNFTTKFVHKREKAIKSLQQKLSVEKIYHTESNFILLKVKNLRQILENFSKQNLLIKDFSSILPNTVRFSLADDLINAKILECF